MLYSVQHSPETMVYAQYSCHNKPCRQAKTVLQQYYIHLHLGGQCEMIVDSRPHQLQAWDLLILQPGQTLQFNFEPQPKSTEMYSGNYSLFCHGNYVEKWWSKKRRPEQMNIRPNNGLLAIFGELIQENCEIEMNWQDASNYLVQVLFIHIDRALDKNEIETNHPSFITKQMKTYINKNISSPFKVIDVARAVGLSPSRASTLFKEIYGQTIMSYALNQRLTNACCLIRNTSRTLEQAALMSGFGSYSYFHRAFQKKYGLAPSEYRTASGLQAVHDGSREISRMFTSQRNLEF